MGRMKAYLAGRTGSKMWYLPDGTTIKTQTTMAGDIITIIAPPPPELLHPHGFQYTGPEKYNFLYTVDGTFATEFLRNTTNKPAKNLQWKGRREEEMLWIQGPSTRYWFTFVAPSSYTGVASLIYTHDGKSITGPGTVFGAAIFRENSGTAIVCAHGNRDQIKISRYNADANTWTEIYSYELNTNYPDDHLLSMVMFNRRGNKAIFVTVYGAIHILDISFELGVSHELHTPPRKFVAGMSNPTAATSYSTGISYYEFEYFSVPEYTYTIYEPRTPAHPDDEVEIDSGEWLEDSTWERPVAAEFEYDVDEEEDVVITANVRITGLPWRDPSVLLNKTPWTFPLDATVEFQNSLMFIGGGDADPADVGIVSGDIYNSFIGVGVTQGLIGPLYFGDFTASNFVVGLPNTHNKRTFLHTIERSSTGPDTPGVGTSWTRTHGDQVLRTYTSNTEDNGEIRYGKVEMVFKEGVVHVGTPVLLTEVDYTTFRFDSELTTDSDYDEGFTATVVAPGNKQYDWEYTFNYAASSTFAYDGFVSFKSAHVTWADIRSRGVVLAGFKARLECDASYENTQTYSHADSGSYDDIADPPAYYPPFAPFDPPLFTPTGGTGSNGGLFESHRFDQIIQDGVQTHYEEKRIQRRILAADNDTLSGTPVQIATGSMEMLTIPHANGTTVQGGDMNTPTLGNYVGFDLTIESPYTDPVAPHYATIRAWGLYELQFGTSANLTLGEPMHKRKHNYFFSSGSFTLDNDAYPAVNLMYLDDQFRIVADITKQDDGIYTGITSR